LTFVCISKSGIQSSNYACAIVQLM